MCKFKHVSFCTKLKTTKKWEGMGHILISTKTSTKGRTRHHVYFQNEPSPNTCSPTYTFPDYFFLHTTNYLLTISIATQTRPPPMTKSNLTNPGSTTTLPHPPNTTLPTQTHHHPYTNAMRQPMH